MAVFPCPKCGKEVSSTFHTCANCGAIITPAAPKSAPQSWIVNVLIFLVFIPAFIWFMADRHEAEQQEKARTEAEAEKARRAPENIRLNRVAEIVNTLKTNLREPDSVVWKFILANDDASVVCIQYRARNGFGGMGEETMVIAKGKASQENGAWNKHCTGKKLHDVSNVKYVLDH